ncbi:MAG: Putative methyltransferase [uncultured Rubrobacteraceae bacterium]|uniref:Methyltransferase n=1 Tax=uncultured Rubrobacteraceae bacterium TaxID=349277 RepID=A0A6J4TGZ9_9ACTN|nr:MAG: Putative methyltransferase [uncultured Rubrobacteraceae bacterium]
MQDPNGRLRSTFDAAASLYDEVRPGYPEAVLDDAVSLSGVPSGGRILEVGCGTGQATLPLARRGFEILCVELGANLAAVARGNLAAYPRVEVLTGDFETAPLPEGAFDLLVSATAFHWLDPAVAYPKAARALKPGGAIALFWNEHVATDADGGFFADAQEIYAREAPEIWDGTRSGPPDPEDLPERTGEIEGSGLFGPVVRRTHLWEQAYDAQGYLRVLDTYSGHIALGERTRARLHESISRLIRVGYGGRIVKGYATTLYVAPRT